MRIIRINFNRREYREQIMARSAIETLGRQDRALSWAEQAVIVIAASLFVAICARITVPLPFTPVPLTMQNFAVLLVGLTLGSRRGFAALALYLLEGASGMPVFSIAGLGGVAQLMGPTGGYLMAYPFAAFIAGWIMEHGRKNFTRAAVASVLGDVVLFAGGIGWLFVYTHSFARALQYGLYWFVLAEVIKVLLASGIASGWKHFRKANA
jgi:biotin transport system substrate-specific component